MAVRSRFVKFAFVKAEPEIFVAVVAAGVGARYGASVPKQFVAMGGRPVVMHTVDRLRELLPGAKMVLVISESMMAMWKELCVEHSFVSPDVVAGGATRGESVAKALAVMPDTADVAVVHDGVRPVVARRIIDAGLKALTGGAEGAIPAVPETQSLRRHVDGGWVPVDRAEYVAVQTPQFFDAHLLRKAYAELDPARFTDDASMLSALGHDRVEIVAGDPHNIKITHPLDVEIAALYISAE